MALKGRIKRTLLRGVTLCSPVVLAACYGMEIDDGADYGGDVGVADTGSRAFGLRKAGRVVDGATKRGVRGMAVSCLSNGTTIDSDWTDRNGKFSLRYRAERDCDTLRIDDIDGDLNGAYTAQRIDAAQGPDGRDLLVELERSEG